MVEFIFDIMLIGIDLVIAATLVGAFYYLKGDDRSAVIYFCGLVTAFNLVGEKVIPDDAGFTYHFGAVLTDAILVVMLLKWIKPSKLTRRLYDVLFIFMGVNAFGWIMFQVQPYYPDIHIISQLFTFLASSIYIYVLYLTMKYGDPENARANRDSGRGYRFWGHTSPRLGNAKTHDD